MGAYVQATLPDLSDKNISNETVFTGTGPNVLSGAAHRRYTRWIDNVGHYLLKQIDLEIGGQLIDRHFGDWLEIWAQLTVPASQEVGYRKLIGQDPRNALGQNTGLQADLFSRTVAIGQGASNPVLPVTNAVIKGRTIFVPLQFWFCRHEGLALPLIALQYHEVKVAIEFRQSYELIQVNLGDRDGSWATTVQMGECISLGTLDASLWVDYVYLDTEERRRFSQASHEYLIEQLQFTGDEMVYFTQEEGETKYTAITLNFNHPVKELVWVLKCFEDDKEWSNFTDTGLSSVPPVQLQSVTMTSGSAVVTTGLTGLPPLSSYVALNSTEQTAASLAAINNLDALTRFSHYDTVRPIGRTTTYGLAQNPVIRAKILINGQDRMSSRPGSYFNWVQTMNHHTNIPKSPGINVYSFALYPEKHDPSGTCNFSRLDRAKLHLYTGVLWRDGQILSPNVGQRDLSGIVKVFAVNYNILRIMNGMGGLAYTT